MGYTVQIHSNGNIVQVDVKPETRLLDVIREASLEMAAPCGGKGTCGKCLIRLAGPAKEPGEEEIAKIGSKAVSGGYRLACKTYLTGNADVYIPDSDEKAIIKTDGHERAIVPMSMVKKRYMDLGMPGLEDQRGDLERIYQVTGATRCNLDLMAKLPSILRSCGFNVTITSCCDEIMHIEPGDRSTRLYGMAVDIGTTTIAAYLVDLVTFRKKEVYSCMNPQRTYGADVISRISHIMENPEGTKELQRVILDCFNEIIGYFCQKAHISASDLNLITVVGNTTMIHFLLGLDARNIASAPFIPATTSMHILDAAALGLDVLPGSKLVALPSVSAYIGADTVAAILSSGLYESPTYALLLDLGTNGEIALGSRDHIFACSTAAGPAFEGANIRNGMPGIGGAIDTVTLYNKQKKKPEFSFTVISSGKPLGICGSGIVDAIAGMLETGIIDVTGRIQDLEEMPESTRLYYHDRLITLDGMKAFLLVPQQETAGTLDIAITQKDVRELQNAKAAIAAGPRILLKEAGIQYSDIRHIYLAGGFGSYIDVSSALDIGLLPSDTGGKIVSLGNAAGAGAVEGLISVNMLRQAGEISSRIQYVELSARSDFMDEYMECMMYGEE
ncbi:MAG TPA: ferredoxin [Clostridiales bacterium]|nr:ferredoxin [Clostridiales bacterium]